MQQTVTLCGLNMNASGIGARCIEQTDMKADQFDALAELMRIQNKRSRAAARLVLVDGRKQAEASRATGLSRSGVSSILARLTKGLELARRAAGTEQEETHHG